MAQSGYTPISLYYSSTTGAVPTAGQLVNGEFGLNIRDGKLYYKSAAGVVTLLANSTSPLAIPVTVDQGGTGLTSVASGRILFGNSSTALNTSSSLYFDGTSLIVGPGSTIGGSTNPYLAITGNTNNYIQGYIHNANSGTSSSSDWVAYPDNGTDASGYVDLGVNSSTYADAAYTVTTFNEAYLFGSAPSGASKSGNFVFATDSTGTTNSFQWYVGGFTQAKSAWKMQLTSTGLQLANALSVAYGGTGLTSTPSNGQLLIGNGTNYTLATLTQGTGVTISNTSGAITISATGSGGTVTTVSVASANGFAGTVANATTTPAITISTSITGLLYGNGTALAAVSVGSGLSYSAGSLSNSGVTGMAAGSGISVSAATGNVTVTNTGVTGVTAGTGITLSGTTGNVTVTNAGVTSFTSSSGLSVNTSATGAVSVTNTGVTGVTAGTGITVSGPTGNVTVTNSAPMTYPSGSGIAVVSSGTSWGTTLTAPSGAVVGTTDTQTLSSKRVTPRIGTTTSAGTITPTSDLSDQYNVTALATTAAFAIPSGTPTDGQKLSIRIYAGTTQTISWTTTAGGYRVIGTTLPTSVPATKTIYVGCVYNAADSFWDVVAVATQA